jgi:hypothetical protein
MKWTCSLTLETKDGRRCTIKCNEDRDDWENDARKMLKGWEVEMRKEKAPPESATHHRTMHPLHNRLYYVCLGF